jgi:transposase
LFLEAEEMAKAILDDDLWKLIEALLPPPKPRRTRYPRRKRLEDRKELSGILIVLESGIPWEMLPKEMGCGSGMSCWRRLRAWQEAGVWDRLHEVLLARLRAADRIDWSRVIVDSASIRAVGAGQKQDRIPPIALAQAPSTISSPKREASRSR